MPGVIDASVRAAVESDAAAACAIYNAAIADRESTFEAESHAPAEFAAKARDDRHPFLVALRQGEVIGWAALAPYSARPHYSGVGEVSVYVAADARGGGVGATLLEALVESARSRGFHKVLGKLFDTNEASIRLFEGHGFSIVGVHRRHGQIDGRWRDVVVVERIIGIPK